MRGLRGPLLSLDSGHQYEEGSVEECEEEPVKGILPHKNFYHPNLIFWIVMGCGRARFGRKGQKTPKIENFGLKVCSLGPRGDRS